MARASLGFSPLPKLILFHHQNQSSRLSPSIPSAVHVNTAATSSAAVAIPEDQPPPHSSLEIIGAGGARGLFLPALKTLTRPYNPFPLIGWNCHVETIFAAFFLSVPEVRLRIECLRTMDDGSVALDWVSDDGRTLPADSPLLILLVC